MKPIYLRSDSRDRISLKKVVQQVEESEKTSLYRATVIKGGKIILEPIHEEPSPDAWLFEPQNQELLRHVQESLKQEANVSYPNMKVVGFLG